MAELLVLANLHTIDPWASYLPRLAVTAVTLGPHLSRPYRLGEIVLLLNIC
jgi:hypothetical protein